jgi:GWxTD domain-containing protein
VTSTNARAPVRRLLRRGAPLLGLLLLALPARAKFEVEDALPENSLKRPRFLAEAASYLGSDGPTVQLGFQVPYRELFFRPSDHRYRSEFDLIMLVKRHGEQINGDSWNEKTEVASFADTRSQSEMVRQVYALPCPPGRYQAEVTVRESRAGRENRVEWSVEVPDYANLPLSISSFWISACSQDGADSLAVPPLRWELDRRFGEPQGQFCFLGEIYRAQESSEPVRVTWRVLGLRNEVAQRGDLSLSGGRRLPFRLRPSFSSLWLGSYTLEVTVRCGAERAVRRFTFFMQETAGAMENDPDQSLALVGLIATAEEQAALRAASTPLERKEAWNRFWKAHDPTPDTPENEFKEEFFARVRYANEHFSVLEPGWRSDRGSTYIRYGPPDQVESSSSNMDQRPYEIWTYTRLGRRFVFVDYEGFGRYELYQPGRS